MANDTDELSQTTETGETIGTGNDERLARLSSIADQADREREEELANVNDDGSTEPFKAAEPEVEQEAAAEPEAESAAQPEEPAEKRYKIKVNGKELELTESELIARAQKIEAADEYLRQAAEARKQPVYEPPAGPTPDEIQRQRDAEDRALVRAIQMGTEEEAAAALRKLREQTNARPSLSADDVSRVIDERLEFTKAIEKFRTEYADIESDPFLKKLALDKDQEYLNAGDRRPYWERYDEIGKSLRAWKESLAPAATPTISEKEQRKATAPKAPVAASAKQRPPAPVEDDIDDAPSAVIQAMAKSRGGPQWMRN